MSGSAELYAVATEADREARHHQHRTDPLNPRACAPWCTRCRLEAKARLHGRAGDSAKTLEDRA